MARDWFINGPLMVLVKGNPLTGIGTIQQLGLTHSPVRVRHNYRHMDLSLDAFGGEIPAEMQCKLQDVFVDMDLVHVDATVLEICMAESLGGMGTVGVGTLPLAGARLGNNFARFGAGWHYIGLNLASTVNGIPWRFSNAYLTGQPLDFPLGSERSIITLTWRVIPYSPDPFNLGLYSYGYTLYDHVLDT